MSSVSRRRRHDFSARRALVAVRQRRAAFIAAAGFGVVLLCVVTRLTQGLDQTAAEWFRPDDEWGPAQVRLGPVIAWLEPRRAYLALGVVTACVCLRRHSWRPGVFAGLVTGLSMGATLAVKVLTHRPDTLGNIGTTGGSFPSGHAVALLTCLACCALMCSARTRWWHWVLVAIPPAVMAAALLYTATHWVTDVLGGALLAIATICWAASSPLRSDVLYPTWGSSRGVRGAARPVPGELSGWRSRGWTR